MSHINAAMAAAVGRVTGRRTSFPISESDIRRWAVAVYWPKAPPRIFWDPDYAGRTRHGELVAPEEFNPFAWMVSDSDPLADPGTPTDPERTEHILGIEGPGLAFEVHGGVEVDYAVRMRPGDVITAVSRLAGYAEKEGRLGLMLLTVTEETWTNQAGALVKRSRATSIRY